MPWTISRRELVAGAVLSGVAPVVARAQDPPDSERWSLPIRNDGSLAGNGFLIRHGFSTENTWYNPGWWHTAEDWYRAGDEDTAGAEVLAVHAGEVAWIGSDYPGRVVLVKHASGLYAMYGHLDFDVDVTEGERVASGQVLGRVLRALDGWRAPNHLHFEIRDFFFNPIVNGDSPKYQAGCTDQCPPGPGYWPIDDPRHPAEVGWRNPTHVIHRGVADSRLPSEVVVADTADGLAGPVRSEPRHDADAVVEMTLRAGDRFPVAGVDIGKPATTATSATAYRLWYRVRHGDGEAGWLPGVMADDRDTGSDGRPSSVRPVLLPNVE